MTVLLDTNIIMDALQERQPFDTAAKEILLRSQNGEFSFCFTANTITDIFYLYSKTRGMKPARNVLEFLLAAYKIISVSHDDCISALSIPIEDFEDALITHCAKKADVDYIITRDEKLLRDDKPVKTISPKDFLEKLSPTSKTASTH
ncbi:MAG: PIN domain-containing protein [Oscillospiraceae bacterium]|nr:PIN domain-containing protein [Oscillospiraceae bacterium]